MQRDKERKKTEKGMERGWTNEKNMKQIREKEGKTIKARKC